MFWQRAPAQERYARRQRIAIAEQPCGNGPRTLRTADRLLVMSVYGVGVPLASPIGSVMDPVGQNVAWTPITLTATMSTYRLAWEGVLAVVGTSSTLGDSHHSFEPGWSHMSRRACMVALVGGGNRWRRGSGYRGTYSVRAQEFINSDEAAAAARIRVREVSDPIALGVHPAARRRATGESSPDDRRSSSTVSRNVASADRWLRRFRSWYSPAWISHGFCRNPQSTVGHRCGYLSPTMLSHVADQ